MGVVAAKWDLKFHPENWIHPNKTTPEDAWGNNAIVTDGIGVRGNKVYVSMDS